MTDREHAATTAEPARPAPAALVDPGVPAAPVPLPVNRMLDADARPRPRPRATGDAPRLLRTADAAVAPAPAPTPAPAPAEAQGKLNLAPTTLDELLDMSGVALQYLLGNTTTVGPMRGILLGAFEGDWFKAKSALVFDKWPGEKRPKFSHEYALKLMTALTEYRGAVHKTVMPLAQKQVKLELRKRATQLKGNQKLGAALTKEQKVPGVKQVEYKGSVGADTVTSDVDVSTGGINSELAVRAYNEAFRSFMGTGFDPGTVFDLNVYAKDFIHGFTDNADKTVITPKGENAEKPDAAQAADRDREQDIWSLVHVARYLPLDADWGAYVTESVAGLPEDRAADQRDRLKTARRRAQGFEWRLLSMMEELATSLDLGLGKASEWEPHDDAHFKEGALRMRAANKIYEDKLLQVKELRLQIDAVRAGIQARTAPAGSEEQLRGLIARLDGELSMAQLYANEVYGSGGGTVHAVMGMQMPKKLSKDRGKTVTANIPKQQWYAAFTDNLGDVLKDYEHYGTASGHGEPDYWYAAFKMGKYANRMVDAVKHLADGSPDDLLGSAEHQRLLADDRLALLTTLSKEHLEQKDGDGGTDPLKLKKHAYFGGFDATRLGALRAAALGFGAAVRTAIAQHSPAAAAKAPVTGFGEVGAERLERARADVARALTRAMALQAEAAGPAGPAAP